MATENYGVFAQLVNSIASTPVSTDTTIYFIGSSPSGDLNKPHLITSLAEYATLLGGEPNDGYNLSEAAVAAFQIAGISKCYMIPVSHSTTFNASDYIGSASAFTGVHAIAKQLSDNPTLVNILCAPSITDSTVISALLGVAKKAGGHWDSFVIADQDIPTANVTDGILTNASITKNISDEYGVEVVGRVKTTAGYSISGAAVRACLMALADASYGVPARCSGNLAVPSMQELVFNTSNELTNSCVGQGGTRYTLTFTITQDGYTDYNGILYCSAVVSTMGGDVSKSDYVTFANGVGTMDFAAGSSITSPSVTTHKVFIDSVEPIYIPESMATQLSADGICTFLNVGGGSWRTWGDHTSAFSAGSIADERGRFDNSIRMLQLIMNRFQLKYRFSVDAPMTLQMRNDVINEEQDYLNSLVAIGALVGEPKVEFRAVDNGNDQVAQGYFTWSLAATPTIPFKYGLLKTAYSQAGLSVYTQAE